jgi:hypothetical protein
VLRKSPALVLCDGDLSLFEEIALQGLVYVRISEPIEAIRGLLQFHIQGSDLPLSRRSESHRRPDRTL